MEPYNLGQVCLECENAEFVFPNEESGNVAFVQTSRTVCRANLFTGQLVSKLGE